MKIHPYRRINTSINIEMKHFCQKTHELTASINPLTESMSTENSISDDSETDDFIDYDPDKTIDDTLDSRLHQSSFSGKILKKKEAFLLKRKAEAFIPKGKADIHLDFCFCFVL